MTNRYFSNPTVYFPICINSDLLWT